MDGFELELPPGLATNDPNFTRMEIHTKVFEIQGELIGKHEHLKELLVYDVYTQPKEEFEAFARGVAKNRSIEKLIFACCNGMWGDIFGILTPFIENNSNLRTLNFDECDSLGDNAEEISVLATLLGKCSTNSLEEIILARTELSYESARELVVAFGSLPRLKNINLSHNVIRHLLLLGDLAALLRKSSTLEKLNITRCGIQDESVEVLVVGLAENKSLKYLYLVGGFQDFEHSSETTIGQRGWKELAVCLGECSSIKDTFQSNHTLEHVYQTSKHAEDPQDPQPPKNICSLLALNSDANKQRVAMKKILMCHHQLDMSPLFRGTGPKFLDKWELKLLPLAVQWLSNAKALTSPPDSSPEGEDLGPDIDTRKLNALFQFCRGMPDEMATGFQSTHGEGRKRKSEEVVCGSQKKCENKLSTCPH